MIAWASMQRFLKGDHDDYSVELRKDWKLEELGERLPLQGGLHESEKLGQRSQSSDNIQLDA